MFLVGKNQQTQLNKCAWNHIAGWNHANRTIFREFYNILDFCERERKILLDESKDRSKIVKHNKTSLVNAMHKSYISNSQSNFSFDCIGISTSACDLLSFWNLVRTNSNWHRSTEHSTKRLQHWTKHLATKWNGRKNAFCLWFSYKIFSKNVGSEKGFLAVNKFECKYFIFYAWLHQHANNVKPQGIFFFDAVQKVFGFFVGCRQKHQLHWMCSEFKPNKSNVKIRIVKG